MNTRMIPPILSLGYDLANRQGSHGMTGRLVGGPANAFCIYGFPGSVLNEGLLPFL